MTTVAQAFPIFVALYYGYERCSHGTSRRTPRRDRINGTAQFYHIVQVALLRSALRLFECYGHDGSQDTSLVSRPEVLCDLDDSSYAVPFAFAVVNLTFLLALFPLQMYFVWKLPLLLVEDEWRDAAQFLIERFRPSQFW